MRRKPKEEEEPPKPPPGDEEIAQLKAILDSMPDAIFNNHDARLRALREVYNERG
jgi:hypothetical protein